MLVKRFPVSFILSLLIGHGLCCIALSEKKIGHKSIVEIVLKESTNNFHLLLKFLLLCHVIFISLFSGQEVQNSVETEPFIAFMVRMCGRKELK